VAGDFNIANAPCGWSGPRHPCLHQPQKRTNDPFWHTSCRSALCRVGQQIGSVIDRQGREPAYYPAHDRGPPAACRLDINTILAWLGHVSLDTTHIYAEVDMEMKAKALASVDISALPESSRRANATPSLMSFLKAL
jgi:hypothetical protein